MILKINKKSYEVKELNNFISKFKSLKFVLEPLDYVVKIPNTKIANTYFFVQRVDVCFTDEQNRIIKLVKNVRSEKLLFELSATHVYYLPLGCAKEYRINDILK